MCPKVTTLARPSWYLSFVFICRGLVAGGAQGAMSGVSSGGASNSGSASFLAYTPNSTLAITAASTTPHSASGSVAGPLALTPVRRMDLPLQGMPFIAVSCYLGSFSSVLSYSIVAAHFICPCSSLCYSISSDLSGLLIPSLPYSTPMGCDPLAAMSAVCPVLCSAFLFSCHQCNMHKSHQVSMLPAAL